MAGLKAQPARGQGALRRLPATSTSAAATRACARSSSPATRGQEDPGCYLDDEEIGRAPRPRRRRASRSRPFAVRGALRQSMRRARCLAERSRSPPPVSRWPPTWRWPSRRARTGALRASTARPATAPTAWAAWARRCCRRTSSGCARPRRWQVDRARAASATQMPAFADKLVGRARSTRWSQYIYTPLDAGAELGRGRDPRLAHRACRARRSCPRSRSSRADPLNLFVVVEAGDHHVIDPRRRPVRAASTASRRASRCTAGRSSRPTGATSTSPRATAGSPSTTSGT